MDTSFVHEIEQWFAQSDDPRVRDLEQGALLLLRATRNRVQYQNIIRNPQRYADLIDYQLQKKLTWYLADLTHEQVTEMQRQVEHIAEKRHLSFHYNTLLSSSNAVNRSIEPDPSIESQVFHTNNSSRQPSKGKGPITKSRQGSPASSEAEGSSTPSADEWAEIKRGKRADHDQLPQEIQDIYVEQLEIMNKMRALHAKLCQITDSNTSCPDGDRYPFLKEIIALDKQYGANWKRYDSYK